MQNELSQEKKACKDFERKMNEAAQKALQEMLKHPYSFQEAKEHLLKLKAERNKR